MAAEARILNTRVALAPDNSVLNLPSKNTPDNSVLNLSSKENNGDQFVVQSIPPKPDFPEGGFWGWAVVVGAFLVNFCGFGYTTSFGVYQDYYTRFYLTSESASTISWIGSINGFIVISSGLVVGRLYDRGYFYYMVYGGAVLMTFSLFMLSLTKQDQFYQIFLAQGLGHGIGAGIMFVPCMAIPAQYFHEKRALAMSIVASGSSLGALIHPIMLNNTFDKLGFANTVRASAGMVAGLLIIACPLMHPRLPPAAHQVKLWTTLKKFVKDKAYILASFGFMLFPLGMYFPLFYIQLDAVQHGLSEHFAFYSLVILNAGSFIGRLSPGILAKPIGIVPLIITATSAGAALILSLIGITTVAGFVVFAILFGFSAGIFISLMTPLVALLTEDMSELGLRIGFAFAFCGVGNLIGPPIQGALLTSQYHWWKPALFSGVLGFVGLFCLSLMGWLLRRPKQEKVFDLRRDVERASNGGENVENVEAKKNATV